MSWWNRLAGKVRRVFGAANADQPATAGQLGCDHSNITLREGTADFEWFVARGELESGDNLEHGAGHLCNLLTYDPGRREWLDLLDAYLAKADPDPEALIPRGAKLYAGTESVRAYIYHRQGRLVDAVDLLSQVVQSKMDSRYLEAWALDWLEPARAVESLPNQTALLFFSLGLNRFPEADLQTTSQAACVQRYASLLDRWVRGREEDSMTTMLRVGLHRKAGNFDRALAIVRKALDRAPNWHATTALGLVLRQQGNVDEAEKAFEWALRLDGSDISARLEAGDMFYDRELWQRALTWYESALAKDARHPWAKPSAHFCRWKLSGDEKHLKLLFNLLEKTPDNQRARFLCQQAYGSGLPEPVDATANILRQFRETILTDRANAPAGEAKIAISCLEAPSNYLAFRVEMEALKQDLRIQVTVNRIPHPDPRKPIADVKYLLWRYEGTDAFPALDSPPPEILESIAAIAVRPFDYQAYWAAASRAAATIKASRVGQLLAAMVHPPPVPSTMGALQWLPRVQFVVMAIVAHLEQEWEGSVRREALLSVLHGPMDWTTDAAIRALTQLGCEYEPIAPDIHDAFQLLADNRPDQGYWGWERTLYTCWQQLPHLFPKEREEMQRRVAEMDRAAQSEN